MYALVEALSGLAVELGVDVQTGQSVRKLLFGGNGSSLKGVLMKDGKSIACRKAVVNMDAVSAIAGTLNH